MNKTDYHALCTDVAKEFSLDKTQTDLLLNHGRFKEKGGTEIGIFFGSNPNLLYLTVDLGPIDKAHEAEIHRQLLQANLFSAHPGNVVFALEPSSHHALMMSVMPAKTRPATAKVMQRLGVNVMQARHMASLLKTGKMEPADHPAAAHSAAAHTDHPAKANPGAAAHTATPAKAGADAPAHPTATAAKPEAAAPAHPQQAKK